jgi:acetyl-CoA carboxylase biotin carboxyl carrier protein
MDLRKIKTLIQLLQESELAEIEVSDGEQSVRLSRASQVPSAPAAPAVAGQSPSCARRLSVRAAASRRRLRSRRPGAVAPTTRPASGPRPYFRVGMLRLTASGRSGHRVVTTFVRV